MQVISGEFEGMKCARVPIRREERTKKHPMDPMGVLFEAELLGQSSHDLFPEGDGGNGAFAGGGDGGCLGTHLQNLGNGHARRPWGIYLGDTLCI